MEDLGLKRRFERTELEMVDQGLGEAPWVSLVELGLSVRVKRSYPGRFLRTRGSHNRGTSMGGTVVPQGSR